MGVAFTVTSPVSVAGISFYSRKFDTTQTRTCRIWSCTDLNCNANDGVVAFATSSKEVAGSHNKAYFSSPVALSVNKGYAATCSMPQGFVMGSNGRYNVPFVTGPFSFTYSASRFSDGTSNVWPPYSSGDDYMIGKQ